MRARVTSSRRRPFGYNPIELNRFVVGIHPLGFRSAAVPPLGFSMGFRISPCSFRGPRSGLALGSPLEALTDFRCLSRDSCLSAHGLSAAPQPGAFP